MKDNVKKLQTGGPIEPPVPQQPAVAALPQITPIVFTAEQLDTFRRQFQNAQGGPARIIAQELSSEFATESPEYSYENLISGTSQIFDLNPSTASIPANQRGLTDEQIIQLFATDPEGNPIGEGLSPMGLGFVREIIPSTASFRAGVESAALSQRLLPPSTHPYVRLGAGTLAFLGGAFGGYSAGEGITNIVLGEGPPLLPSQRAAYEQGRTLAGVTGWLTMPFALPKETAFGTGQYLLNLSNMGVKPSRATRFLNGFDTMLVRSGQQARSAPITTLAYETAAGGGSTFGAGFSETYFPDNPLARVLFEVGGGLLGTAVAVPGVPLTQGVATGIQRWFQGEKVFGGVVDSIKAKLPMLQANRQRQGVARIVQILEADELAAARGLNIGEEARAAAQARGITDPAELDRIVNQAEQDYVTQRMDELIERLSSDDFSNILVDETGKPINLTAGAKSGNASLVAIENSLSQLGNTLLNDRVAGAQQSVVALRNAILAMAQSGDQDALQTAGDLAEGIFSAELTENLARATDNVVTSWTRIRGDNPESNMELSNTLFEIIKTQMRFGRNKEKYLWEQVESVNAPLRTSNDAMLYDYNAQRSTRQEASDEQKRTAQRFKDQAYNFLEYWNGARGITPEMQDMIERGMPAVTNFVNRIKSDVDAYVTTLLEGGEPDINSLPSTAELNEIRGIALSYARQFTSGANPDPNMARIAYEMADNLLQDIERPFKTPNEDISDGARIAYQTARSYSAAFNDTFTRAFAGEVTRTRGSGANFIAPELLANRILQGGNDPTFLRVQQIQDVGNFSINQKLNEYVRSSTGRVELVPDSEAFSPEETMGTLLSTTEQIIRNARAAAFNPETGQVNPDVLARWISQNEDILNVFPALKRDLQDAQQANIILNDTTQLNKNRQRELEAQVSFYDLMNPRMQDGRRVFGTESPTTAIARSLNPSNRTPIRSLNQLLEIANNAPEDLREGALSGLRSSILEYATLKAGNQSGSFSPISFYNTIFNPIPGSQNRITLSSWMVENNVMDQSQLDNLKVYLAEMAKYEGAMATGNIDEVIETAGPLFDFFLGVTGSALGTRAQRLIPGSSGAGALIAASKGAQAMRDLFLKLPQAVHVDVMSELMKNPKLLAQMMRQPRTDAEKLRLANAIGEELSNLGFLSLTTPIRRELPGMVRETLEESPQPAPTEEEDTQTEPMPTAQNIPTLSGGFSPSPFTMAPAGQQVPSISSSGPVDRARFAAFFPEDRELMGIGSLMG